IHDANGRHIQTVEDLIKKRRIATRARDVERIEYAVLEDIRLVELDGIPQLRAFVAHVADFQRQVLCQFALNREIDVLAVLNHTVVRESAQCRSAVGQWDWIVRFRATGRQWHETRVSTGNVEVCLRRVDKLDLRPRLSANLTAILLVRRRTGVVDAVASTNDSALLKPRHRPAESDRRREVVPVVLIRQHVWIGRVLARRFYIRQRSARCIGIPQRAEVRTGNTEEPGLTAFHARDRKSTRLNSSHVAISYAVFCLKKKKTKPKQQ